MGIHIVESNDPNVMCYGSLRGQNGESANFTILRENAGLCIVVVYATKTTMLRIKRNGQVAKRYLTTAIAGDNDFVLKQALSEIKLVKIPEWSLFD